MKDAALKASLLANTYNDRPKDDALKKRHLLSFLTCKKWPSNGIQRWDFQWKNNEFKWVFMEFSGCTYEVVIK